MLAVFPFANQREFPSTTVILISRILTTIPFTRLTEKHDIEAKPFDKFPYLFRDRVPTVLLEEWPLSCRLFDGEAVSGPVPTLFSDRPDAARLALESDPERACQDLAKIFRKFAIHEYIPAGLGWATVLKPR